MIFLPINKQARLVFKQAPRLQGRAKSMPTQKNPLFKVLKTIKLPNFNKITSVAVVAFNKDSNILAVNLKKRGIDVPGGHVEKEDSTIRDTAKRETREEACAELEDDLRVSAIIESNYYKYPTYVIVLAGRIKRLNKFTETDEVSSRKFMNCEDFLKRYKYDKKLMREIIKKSLLKVNDNSKQNQSRNGTQ